MMGGNVEATQRGVIAAEMIPMLEKEAKERSLANLRIGQETPTSPHGLVGETKDLAPKRRSAEVVAEALRVGPTSVSRALRAKKKHEVRVPLTVTQRKFLLLLRRGHCLEVEKRGPGYISIFCGAEIAGRGIRFDAAQKMISESLVEKLSEDGCTVKYGISPTAVQLLASFREAHR